MIFRNLQNQSRRAIPTAVALLIIGLCSLLIGFDWPTLSSLFPNTSTNKTDFWHGFMIGIALEFGGALIAVSATRRLRQNR